MSHLILYDGPCTFCNKAIKFVIKHDLKKKFLFSSLNGKTAGSLCNTIHCTDSESIILIENYQTQKQRIFYKNKAVFRILWDLGGIWKLLGFIHFFPSWMIDWSYDVIAKRRNKMCEFCPFKQPTVKKNARFLP